MTKTERAHNLIDAIAHDAQRAAIRNVLIELRTTLRDADAAEIPGLRAAIDIVSANFQH